MGTLYREERKEKREESREKTGREKRENGKRDASTGSANGKEKIIYYLLPIT